MRLNSKETHLHKKKTPSMPSWTTSQPTRNAKRYIPSIIPFLIPDAIRGTTSPKKFKRSSLDWKKSNAL